MSWLNAASEPLELNQVTNLYCFSGGTRACLCHVTISVGYQFVSSPRSSIQMYSCIEGLLMV